MYKSVYFNLYLSKLCFYLGRSVTNWEKDIDWEAINPDGEEDLDEDETVIAPRAAAAYADGSNYEEEGLRDRATGDVREYKASLDYHGLHADLVTNFEKMYEKGELKWPKGFSDADKARHPHRPSVIERMNEETMGALYVQPSTLRRRNNSGEYDVLVGRGLFSRLEYRKHHTIVQFHGDVIDGETYEQLKATHSQKRVAYAHPLNSDCSFYLDCYEYSGVCRASFANSPFDCRVAGSIYAATSNCYVTLNARAGIITLKCKVAHIPANTELTWDYEDTYPYPALLS